MLDIQRGDMPHHPTRRLSPEPGGLLGYVRPPAWPPFKPERLPEPVLAALAVLLFQTGERHISFAVTALIDRLDDLAGDPDLEAGDPDLEADCDAEPECEA